MLGEDPTAKLRSRSGNALQDRPLHHLMCRSDNFFSTQSNVWLCISDTEVIALNKWMAKYLPLCDVYSASAVRDEVKKAMDKDDIDYSAIYELRCIFGYTAIFDRLEDLPFSEAVIDAELVCRIKALMQSETISFELAAVKLGCTPANIAANYEV